MTSRDYPHSGRPLSVGDGQNLRSSQPPPDPGSNGRHHPDMHKRDSSPSGRKGQQPPMANIPADPRSANLAQLSNPGPDSRDLRQVSESNPPLSNDWNTKQQQQQQYSDFDRPHKMNTRSHSWRSNGGHESGNGQFENSKSRGGIRDNHDQRVLRPSMRDSHPKREQPKDRESKSTTGWGLTKLGRSLGISGPTYDDHSQGGASYPDEHHHYREPDHHQELQWLRGEQSKYHAEVERLQQELAAEKAKTEKVKLSANKMQMAMDSKDLFVGVQLTDDVILGKFQNLIAQIRLWSSKFVKTSGFDLAEIPPEVATQFNMVAPSCLTVAGPSDLWKSGKKVRMLIRGWVSLVITNSIFRSVSGVQLAYPGVDVWLGERVGGSVASIENILSYAARKQISLRELHDWRALTFELLSRVDLGRSADQEMRDFLNTSTSRIMAVVRMWALEEALQELREGLYSTLSNAAQFSQLLRRQRACWCLQGPKVPSPPVLAGTGEHEQFKDAARPHFVVFDPTSMKDDNDMEDGYGSDPGERVTKLVELFISPGLFKRGNADGERFELESCIVPRLVLCKES